MNIHVFQVGTCISSRCSDDDDDNDDNDDDDSDDDEDDDDDDNNRKYRCVFSSSYLFRCKN